MNQILVETSARHLHLTEKAVEILFGAGHQLTKKKDLSQPGQFACEEKVEVVGPKGSLKMSVLGPVRPDNQVELSFTDARTLGVTAPVRESGDIDGTPGILLKGPAGELTIENGVIIAKRHIHLTPDEAAAFGLAICWLQRRFSALCPNRLVFNLLAALAVGISITLWAALMPGLHMDKIMIGDIMLLIPGMAMTNAVRDTMVGSPISGVMRLIEALLWAGALAMGFMTGFWLMGRFGL